MCAFGRIIRKEAIVSAVWSGGATTQLAIYPDWASYADRSFRWRVSTATVDAERSDFTLLPGFARVIMVLEGNLRLIYNGSREVVISRFGQDSFDGGWNTQSIGRVRDFNLMMGEGCTGSVEALEIAPSVAGASQASARLHTAEGVRNSDSFTRIDNALVAENKHRSEVYYAITDAILTSVSGDVKLSAGDVYIKTYCETGVSDDFTTHEKLHVNSNVSAPTVVVRAVIIH